VFKAALAKPLALPTNYVVKSHTSIKSRVLRENEEYYQIEVYTVIREGSDMKIMGLRFLTMF
jgi:hypothetical protein